jgi:hypothetical protein
MDAQPSFRTYLIQSLLLAVLGWGGLALMIFYFEMPPLVWARWGFFVLGIMALTGTVLPIVYFLHRRFSAETLAEPHVIVRQALWVGVYVSTLAWLQLGHLVSLWVWMGLAGGLIAVEYLLRIRERARWKPPVTSDDHAS